MSTVVAGLVSSGDAYRGRRRRLAASLKQPIVVFAGHALARSYATNSLPFRAESTFLYLGGPPLEHAALLIEPGSDGDAGVTLYRVPPGVDDALWLGASIGDEGIANACGLSVSRIVDADRLDAAVGGKDVAAFVPPHPDTIARARELCLREPIEAEKLAVIQMRLVKDEEELAAMRIAAEAGMAAHRAAMAATCIGKTEDDVEAALIGAMTARRCRPSFTPIVTVRGEVLHGASAGLRLEPGALMLVDAGAEEAGGYTSDITRTYPVSGEWSAVQRQLYGTVLEAMRTAIEHCRAGKRYRDIHALAGEVICAGLVEAELLRGHPSELADRGAYTLFFPHGVGHLLGLGVHDLEDFGDLASYAPGRTRSERFGDKYLRLDRDLEPGMVVTIEPGIYFVPDIWQRNDLVKPYADAINRKAVDALLSQNFGGIRIEDNVVVRADGEPENLTAALPSDADAVASMVATA